MSLAALIRAMSDAGAPPEAIAIAVEAIETIEQKFADKRALERDRKRRQRDAGRDSHGTVTGQSRDSHGTNRDTSPAPSLDKETSPRPPKEIKPTPTPTDIYNPAGALARGPVFRCPESVDPQHWSDFLANRQRKRLANTATAYRAQIKALSALSDDDWPPGRIVQFAAERGWGAIFDPRGKDDRHGKRSTTDSVGGNDGLGRTTRAALAFVARGGP